MRYIKKMGTHHETLGTACTQRYIDACWNVDEGCYVNLLYDSSKLGELRRVLVEEEVYCCYCMRKLYLAQHGRHRPNVTLEHIIPHQIKSTEWEETKDDYFRFEPLHPDKVRVCFQGKYEQPSVQISQLPHPHYISYHNLVASCDGQTMCCSGTSIKAVSHSCCNNKRQERFVMPIFYCERVNELLCYDRYGKLDYDEDFIREEWFDDQHLNLSSSWLNSVRRFWYELSQSEIYTSEDVEDAIADLEKRSDILDDIDPAATVFPAAVPDNLWIILSEYSWFYGYYKDRARRNV